MIPGVYGNIGEDAGVVMVSDMYAFLSAAKTRQWDREKTVRTFTDTAKRLFLFSFTDFFLYFG